MEDNNNLDELDEAIIRIMGSDARNGPKIIAKNYQASPSTIRRRIARLIKKGIMRIIEADYKSNS